MSAAHELSDAMRRGAVSASVLAILETSPKLEDTEEKDELPGHRLPARQFCRRRPCKRTIDEVFGSPRS